jgi:hypothetical protein
MQKRYTFYKDSRRASIDSNLGLRSVQLGKTLYRYDLILIGIKVVCKPGMWWHRCIQCIIQGIACMVWHHHRHNSSLLYLSRIIDSSTTLSKGFRHLRR